MLDTELNMLILNIGIKGRYVTPRGCEEWGRALPYSHRTDSCHCVPSHSGQRNLPEISYKTLSSTPQLPSHPKFRASPRFYSCRQMWAHLTRQKMTITATESYGYVREGQLGFQ